ncbi:Demethylmenaquinone methyltransferase [Cytospora mali]|uniref:Demethylmenaquinone methyltransferase n=1 Tax=Cytospora mali TaxID=578113 RepID=A0A194UXX0_CYTMA|nr:Demethylmenaquinone methyltransferase [Valsa mali var. pyri (nom. inval.)]
MTMAPQYDAIGSKYAVFKTLPTSIVERENVRAAVLPYLSRSSKPRVLDLACGTGYYSKNSIDWGADYVLGVDISSGMVDVAKEIISQDTKYADKIKFKVGDALSLGKVDGEEPFDIVIGAWLLNYASSLEEMTKMFESISANLKKGGVYIGITTSPVEDVDMAVKRWMEIQAEFPEIFPIRKDYYERLPSGQGWASEISNNSGGEKVTFKSYRLKKSVYEEAARKGGLRGSLVWPEVSIPEEARGPLTEGVWEMYERGCGHMGMLIVEK